MFDFNNVKEVKLSRGAHDSPEHGLCFMEMAAWFAGEKHSDKPACVSPALGRLGIMLNDTMRDYDRDRKLKPMIPHVVGTADEASEGRRVSYICLRAFNYGFGILFPEIAARSGGARDLREAGSIMRHACRDMDISRRFYSRETRDLAEFLYGLTNRVPVYAPNYSFSDPFVHDVAIHDGDVTSAVNLFAAVSRFIPDLSVAIDTLQEAIKLGRHEGFDVSVNLEKRHQELAKLPAAKPKALAKV